MALSNGKNYYEILGVTPDSEVAEIKVAYRKLARKYHPDVNNSPEAVAKFKDITEAYETLVDNVKRNKYNTMHGFFKSYKANSSNSYKRPKEPKFEDRTINKSASKSQEKEEVPPKKDNYNNNQYNSKSTSSVHNSDSNTDKKSGKNIFSDIFDELAKTSKKEKTSSHEPQNGKDINTEISVSLLEVIQGTSRTVNVVHTRQCPKCRGRKFINGSKCSQCSGAGEISEHRKITVKIPPNVKNGAKLRIPKEGNPGINGGQPGDLFLKIQIIPDSRLKYDGIDVIYNVPITPYEAVLGGSISIPYIEGNITLKLPPNTSSGQKFRLSEQGLSKNGKKGDMIIIVSIEIPNSLSDDEIKLYEKLKKISKSNIRENLLNESK